MSIEEDRQEHKSVLQRMRELQDAGLQVPALKQAEPVDPAPLGYIEVRTTRWRIFTDGVAEDSGQRFVMRDGYDVSARPRTLADKGAECVLVETPSPNLTMIREEPQEDYAAWVKRVVTEGANGRTAFDARKAGPGTPSSPVAPRYRSLAEGRTFGGQARNAGVIRSDGIIGEE